MVWSRKSLSRRGSISRATLHSIMGRAKLLREREPGLALVQRPLGLSTLLRTMSKVRLAMSAYSGLWVARESWPKAMTAKV